MLSVRKSTAVEVEPRLPFKSKVMWELEEDAQQLVQDFDAILWENGEGTPPAPLPS